MPPQARPRCRPAHRRFLAVKPPGPEVSEAFELVTPA